LWIWVISKLQSDVLKSICECPIFEIKISPQRMIIAANKE
jgi:hypothetical protein